MQPVDTLFAAVPERGSEQLGRNNELTVRPSVRWTAPAPVSFLICGLGFCFELIQQVKPFNHPPIMVVL